MNKTVCSQTAVVTAALALGLFSTGAHGQQVALNAALGHPLLPSDAKYTTYLKVDLAGFSGSRMERRTPVNIAIVIDRSGSMSGEKIQRAREAAHAAVDRLGPDDIMSLVAYDDRAQVWVPATKASDKAQFHRSINRLEPGGSTALFAGVSKGAAEVRKFLDKERVNRVILVSDGLANVGPSSPSDLAELGASLIKEGISVTTVGLGLDYNEDLMTRLASASDGNHAFVEQPRDLARIFDHEFGDILSVVAQEITVRITCPNGVRPVRVLGRDADVTGRTVMVGLNQLYGDQGKSVLLEVEVSPGEDGRSRDIAKVDVSYANMSTHRVDRLSQTVNARFTSSPREIEANENPKVMASVVELKGVETTQMAVELRDKGRLDEARQLFLKNSAVTAENAGKYKSEALARQSAVNSKSAENLDDRVWQGTRKELYKDSDSRSRNQSW